MSVETAAQDWLAERLHEVDCGCPSGPAGYERHLVEGLLRAPGVEVEVQYVGDPTGPRIAILLPQGVADDLIEDEDADRDCHAPVKNGEQHDTFPVGRQVAR